MLDQKIGHALHRKRTHLSDVGGIVQHTGSNRLIELKRLINELDWGNQHKVKVSRFAAQIKQPKKTLDFSDRGRPCLRDLRRGSQRHSRHAYLAGVKDLESVPHVSAAVQKATKTLDLTPELPKFKFPTMVITGRFDMNVTPVTAWNIYKAIPGAKFVVFEKSGHLPSYEEPDKYVQVVEEFLSQP